MPGDTYMGSQGNGYAYGSVTFAENEERSPWTPFHVQHGFKPTDSTVSIFTGCRSTAFTLGVREKYWREHVRSMLRGMDAHSAPTFLLDPITARQFIDRGGFDTKEKLIEWVYENSLMAAGILGLPADPELHLSARHLRRRTLRVEAESRPGRNDPHVQAGRNSRRRSRRRNQRLLAHHGLQLSEDGVGG